MENRKLNLYEAIKILDTGNGADILDCQKLMKCSQKDLFTYKKYALKTKMVEIYGNRLKLTENRG